MSLFTKRVVGIGVDFGTSSVKVVTLLGDRAGIRLVTYATAPQQNLLVDLKESEGVATMAVLVRAMFASANIGRGEITAAIPVLSVFSTVLELPAMSARELESAVPLAAKNYVPSLLSDVVLSWTAVGGPVEHGPAFAGSVKGAPVSAPAAAPPGVPPGVRPLGESSPPSEKPVLQTLGSPAVPSPPSGGKIQEVFLTAAPRSLVQRYLAVFERLDRPIAVLEVESFPLVRSLLRGETRPVMIVDLGDRATSFSVVDAGYLRVNQGMDIGGEHWTAAVAGALGLARPAAEERKRADGLTGSGSGAAVRSALLPKVREIIAQSETIRRIFERSRGRNLGRVVLIGGGSRLPGIVNFWTETTGLAAEVGNPWRGIRTPPRLTAQLEKLGPSFAVSVGLALRPFDLGH